MNQQAIPFREALLVWLRIALLSFGGPAGQISVMHRILVEEKGWIDERRFLHALNYCMMLPGPEAQQLATYIGWLLHGTRGGIVAGTLFVLPGLIAIMGLSFIYAAFGNTGIVTALFMGIKTAVLAIVLQALVRIGRKALHNRVMYGIAAAAFVAIFVFSLPFPLIIIAAMLAGYFGGRAGHPAFGAAPPDDAVPAPVDRPMIYKSLRTAAVCLALWLGPVAALLLTLGPDHVFSMIAVFFSQVAVVTFGGAYAVLAYVAQQAVETHGWLGPGEMLDGLGMAESTPGPLIMVTQFVGFMGAFRDPGGLSPWLAGTLGGLLTTWVTFAPCFLWIFLGAPYVERLRHNRALSAALTCTTAAVAGVILNLALWFGLHVLFDEVGQIERLGIDMPWPALGSLNLPALVLFAGAMFALFRLRMGILTVLTLWAVLGMLVYSITL